MKSPNDGKNAKKKHKPDDPEQSERFKETAKGLEAVKDAELFERTFKAIVPPAKMPKPPK